VRAGFYVSWLLLQLLPQHPIRPERLDHSFPLTGRNVSPGLMERRNFSSRPFGGSIFAFLAAFALDTDSWSK
jgi:hypothetical protein